jgi:chromosome segregation ATPase
MSGYSESYYLHRTEDGVEYLHVAISHGHVRMVRQAHRVRYLAPTHAFVRDDGESVLTGLQGANGDLSVSAPDGRAYVFVYADDALVQRSHAFSLHQTEVREQRFDPGTFGDVEAAVDELKRLAVARSAAAQAEAAAEEARVEEVRRASERAHDRKRKEYELRCAIDQVTNELAVAKIRADEATRHLAALETRRKSAAAEQEVYAKRCSEMKTLVEANEHTLRWTLQPWKRPAAVRRHNEACDAWERARQERETAVREAARVRAQIESLELRLSVGADDIAYHRQQLEAFLATPN